MYFWLCISPQKNKKKPSGVFHQYFFIQPLIYLPRYLDIFYFLCHFIPSSNDRIDFLHFVCRQDYIDLLLIYNLIRNSCKVLSALFLSVTHKVFTSDCMDFTYLLWLLRSSSILFSNSLAYIPVCAKFSSSISFLVYCYIFVIAFNIIK